MGKEARAASPSLPRIGELIAGKYTIDRILATGGMGVVVAAKHVRLEQRVAIKFLLPEMLDREELVARFLREAQATVGLHGEHAVRVYDVGTLETGSPYLVMELLRGNDLDEELEVRGPLEVEEAIDFMLQACEAIAEAHRVGIVHRDIKPSNLFLARRPDGSRIVKVVDFGISKLLADEAQRGLNNKLTTTRAMLGSPQYMSPEQVRSARDVDGRTDIWSLGCVLYEMLANVPPFSAETVSAVSAMIVADRPPSLRSLRGDAPAELCKVVMRCLEKNRERRFRTVAELAQALAPFASQRSKASVERIVRISHAPRYESSPPPPLSNKSRDADTMVPVKVRADSTTVSEISPGVPRYSVAGPNAETLSATSAAPDPDARTYARRNGLLVGAAALIAGLFVWALIGRAPEHAQGPHPQSPDFRLPTTPAAKAPAAARVPAPTTHSESVAQGQVAAPPASASAAPEPELEPEPVVTEREPKQPKKASAPQKGRTATAKRVSSERKPRASETIDTAVGRGDNRADALLPPPPSIHEDPLSSRK